MIKRWQIAVWASAFLLACSRAQNEPNDPNPPPASQESASIEAARAPEATATVTCNSFSDCKAKILAASDGDTVHIAAARITWTEQIDVSKLVNIEGETISGGKDCTYTDRTILVDNMPRDRNRFFSFNPTKAGVINVSGITFTGEGGAGSNGSAPFITFGNSLNKTDIRLHHCHFTQLKSYGVYIYSGIGGVVDHCVTDKPPSQMMQNGVWNGDYPYGDRNFSQPAGYGANELNNGFFTFESGCVDNTLNGASNAAGGWDAKRGAKFIIRDYEFRGSVEILCHGTEEARQRGGRAQDIYNNHYDFKNICMGLDGIRSGTALFHDNRFSGCKPYGYGLSTYRTFTGFGSIWGGADGTMAWDRNDQNGAVFDSGTTTGGSSSTLVDTSKNWPANKWGGYVVRRDSDGKMSAIVSNSNNTLNTYNYPYAASWSAGQTYKIRRVIQPIDQVGYGAGDLLSGDNPTPRWLNQNTPEGTYSWNNRHDDNSAINFSVQTVNSFWQKEGVTYFSDTKLPGYTPPPFPHPLVSGGGLTPTPTPVPTPPPTATPAPTTPPPSPTATVTVPPPTATPAPSVTPITVILHEGDEMNIYVRPKP